MIRTKYRAGWNGSLFTFMVLAGLVAMGGCRDQKPSVSILPLEGNNTLPDVGPPGHPPVARPIEGTRPEAPCVPDAASDQPIRLTRH